MQSVKVRCNECKLPVYEDLDVNKTYRLIVPSFLEDGGDGFVIIRDNLKNIQPGRLDIDVFVEYLQLKSPVYEEIEGRIEFVGETQVFYRNING